MPFVAQWADEYGQLEERCVETPTMGLPRSRDTSKSLLLIPPSPTSYIVLRRALYLSLGVFGASPAGAVAPIYPDAEEYSGISMLPQTDPLALTAEVRRQLGGGMIVDGKITVCRYDNMALIPAARA